MVDAPSPNDSAISVTQASLLDKRTSRESLDSSPKARKSLAAFSKARAEKTIGMMGSFLCSWLSQAAISIINTFHHMMKCMESLFFRITIHFFIQTPFYDKRGMIVMITKTENPRVFKVNEKDLDILSMSTFESELDLALIATSDSVSLDFTEVEEISSAILGILLAKKMKLKKKGIEINLMNVSNYLQRILKILNLSDYFLPAKVY